MWDFHFFIIFLTSVLWQVTFFNPLVNRRPRLQRQKQLFPKAKGEFSLFPLYISLCPASSNDFQVNIILAVVSFLLFFFTGDAFYQ